MCVVHVREYCAVRVREYVCCSCVRGYVYLCMYEIQRRVLNVLSCHSTPYSPETGSLTKPGTGWNLLSHTPSLQLWDSKGHAQLFMSCWRFESRSSYLHCMHSRALSHLLRTKKL